MPLPAIWSRSRTWFLFYVTIYIRIPEFVNESGGLIQGEFHFKKDFDFCWRQDCYFNPTRSCGGAIAIGSNDWLCPLS